MATQEERLQIVEYDLKHYKTETIKVKPMAKWRWNW